MKGIIQTFLLVFLVTFISRANAGLLVEPVLGYNLSGSMTTDIGGFEDVSGGTGLGMGARLGYTNLGLQVGVDYLKSSITMDDDTVDEAINMTEMGAFVGFKFPVLLRVYAGYIFSANADTEVGTAECKFSEGSGTKFGVGFTGLPFINVNVEYRSGSFDKTEVNDVEVDSDSTYKALMLSLSLPLDL